jgi:hypothetical protein
MNRRRTTRHFSAEPVPRELIALAIHTAGTAPSGAHQQPWTFVAVSDPALKAEIRRAAEEEEQAFYRERATPEWKAALAPLGTDEHKPHLTEAPWIVVLFRQAHGLAPDGTKTTYYYTQESRGIAAGLFIAAVHTWDSSRSPIRQSPWRSCHRCSGGWSLLRALELRRVPNRDLTAAQHRRVQCQLSAETATDILEHFDVPCDRVGVNGRHRASCA